MIYYVEDDKNIRDLVIYTLNQSGFEARGFTNGKEFWQACKTQLPALVLLDIMLPGEDGIQILKKLKTDRTTCELPVMMITAKSTEYDKVIGLDSGADDYLVKPFGMMEMISRVKALLRRVAPKSEPDLLIAEGLVVNVGKHLVTINEKAVVLTYKEFELLRFLLENRGLVFGREKLLAEVWGYDYEGGTRTIDVHIQTLRQKLGAYGELIQTVRGVGYRFRE